MEFSKSISDEPMHVRQKVHRIQTVIHALTAQVLHDPIPASSDHFRPVSTEVPELSTTFLTPETYAQLNRPDNER